MPRRFRPLLIIALLTVGFLGHHPAFSEAAEAPASITAGEAAAIKHQIRELERRAGRTDTYFLLGLGLSALVAAAVSFIVARKTAGEGEKAQEAESLEGEARVLLAELSGKREEYMKELEGSLQRAVDAIREEKERAARFSLLLMDGLKEFEQENYEAALRACEEALEIDTRSPVAWTVKGVSLLRCAGRNEEALQALEEALGLDPRLVLALTAKGAALVGLERQEEALSAFAEALEIDPESVVALTGRGAALVLLERHDEALWAFTEALEHDPRNAPAWAGKGVVLVGLGRHEEALSAFVEAIELAPHYAPAWYNKACAHSKLSQKTEMLEALRTATALDPAYKEKAEEDQDLEPYHDDPEFLEIIEE